MDRDRFGDRAPALDAARRIRADNLARAPSGDHGTIAGRTLLPQADEIARAAIVDDCLVRGYAPRGYGLADFTVLRAEDGWWHLFHIPRVQQPGCWGYHPAHEHWLGHAVTRDFATWITLDPVLCADPALPHEAGHLWAPFALRHAGSTWMFYTGVTERVSSGLAWPGLAARAPAAQALCVATSMDPTLRTWRRHPANPICSGFDWHWRNPDGTVHNLRDPHVVRTDDGFLLVYTAMHCDGCPAVGGLLSNDLVSWRDLGPLLYRPAPPAAWHPESVNVQRLVDGRWVMLPSCSPGLEYRLSSDPYRWHDSDATRIHYEDGDHGEPAGVEILSRAPDDLRWLVAWFEVHANRLFVGALDLRRDPWTLRRLRDPQEVAELAAHTA